MNALLVRAGADQSQGDGRWNDPIDSKTGKFVYDSIPESAAVHPGLKTPYGILSPAPTEFDTILPVQLRRRHMHLDPDFEHLTYEIKGASQAITETLKER